VNSPQKKEYPDSRMLKISRSSPIKKMFIGACTLLVVCVVAISGYMAAGWNLTDSIYMVIITIFGVGYGEVQPVVSPGLRALTIMVIVAGYGAVIYTVGGFMQMLIDGELHNVLGERKMRIEVGNLREHSIICGFGRMGTILARDLKSTNKPFVVIDSDEQRIQLAIELGYLALVGDATDEDTLELAQIAHAKVLATVLSNDAENVFVTITAREMNSNLMIIARGENPKTEKKLKGSGANKVVLPTAIGASKVAQLIIRPSAEDMIDEVTSQGGLKDDLSQIGLQFDELQVQENSPLANQPLSSLEVKSNHGFLIVGIRHHDGQIVINPSADEKLQENDTVIVLGHDYDIPELATKFESQNIMTYRGIKME
jgi:voltage-gated potassium channel